MTNFAEKSDAVSIIVNEKFCPWIKNKNYSEKTTSLLGVFIAGNMKPQLLSGIKKDSPYEGILLTIKTYKVWRKEKLIEELPELEKWSTFNEEQLHKLINQKP